MNQKKAKRIRKENVANGIERIPTYFTFITTKEYWHQRVATPVLDVRDSAEKSRAFVNSVVKANNGNMSRFIPAKWGFSPNGPVKY